MTRTSASGASLCNPQPLDISAGLRRRPRRWPACVLLLVAALAPSGCQRTPAPTTPITPPSATAQASPEQLAAAVFDLLRQERAAIARHDSIAAAAAGETLLSLVDVNEIRKRFAAQPNFRSALGGDGVNGYVRRWAAATGYYLDGLALDQARRVPPGDARRVTLLIPAQHDEFRATLRLEAQRDDAGRWLATQLDFDPPRRPDAPASQPADPPTQPAAAHAESPASAPAP